MTSYDAEVWFFLKAIWQAVPKISFPKLCELVAELLQKPVPAPSSVAKRSRNEKWVKNIRRYCAKADKSLQNIRARLFEELREEYEKIQKDKKDFALATKGHLPAEQGVSDFTFKIIDDIATKNRKTATVLLEHRRRMGKIGQLLDDSMDWMYEAKEAVFDPTKLPEDLEKAKRQFGILEQIVEKIESFSRTAKNLQQADFLLFGISTDDTRDSESDNRLQSIQDDSQFEQARQDLDQQFLEMQRQVAWIESGEFQEQVMKEMEARMRQEEVEDAEFSDCEDDEED